MQSPGDDRRPRCRDRRPTPSPGRMNTWTRRRRLGKGFPRMPYVLDLVYVAAFGRFRADPAPPLLAIGQVSRRLGREGPRPVAEEGGRQPVHLVPRGQRRRGDAPAADRLRPRPQAAGVGRGDLDNHLHRPLGRPPAVPGPGHLLRPARLLLVDPPGRGEGPADGHGARRAGAMAQPRLGGEAVGRPRGDRQRPDQRPEPQRLPQAPRPPGRRFGGSTPWPSRPRNTPTASSTWACPRPRVRGDRLDQVRRARRRSRQSPHAQPPARPAIVAGRLALRRRKHDGGRGTRRAWPPIRAARARSTLGCGWSSSPGTPSGSRRSTAGCCPKANASSAGAGRTRSRGSPPFRRSCSSTRSASCRPSGVWPTSPSSAAASSPAGAGRT